MGVLVVAGTPSPLPFAPTQLLPTNGTYQDLSGTPTFEWQYNPGVPGNTQTNWAFQRVTNYGTTQYWNVGGASWQTTIVWNSGTTTVTNQDFSYTFPSASFADGNVYQWAVATQDANGQGPFSGYWVVNAQSAPSVTVTAPSGTQTTADPTVTWSASFPGGTGTLPAPTQTTFRVVIYNSTQYSAGGFTPGSGPSVYDSGVTGSAYISSLALSGVPEYLADGTSYRAYVQVTETGGQASAWAFSAFTTNYASPNVPTIAVATDTDPGTGCPRIDITVTGHDNYLSAQDAISPSGSGIGTWTAGANTTLSSGTVPVVGGFGISLKATASGSIVGQTVQGTSGYVVTGNTQYSAVISAIAAATGRNFTLAIGWYNSGGGFISGSTSGSFADTTSGLTKATLTATSPATAAYAFLQVVFSSAAANEIHWIEQAGLFLGTETTWGAGGLTGMQQVVLQRSDGLYVRYASIANPGSMPGATQVLTVYDYEASPTVAYTYTAQILVTYSLGNSVVSGTATSGSVTLTTTAWWELDPTNYASATNAQFTNWAPVSTLGATGHMVTGAPVLTVVQDTQLNQDFNATAETFSDAIYIAFNSLLTSQKAIFVSSPWGPIDCGWFIFGPASGGLSSGTGVQAKNTKLMPSVSGAGHREVTVTAIAQYRPAV